jgi:glycosyltransferase involved in cell wall biosynthesis
MSMMPSILFFDVFKTAYFPVIEGIVREGFLPIMNATPLTERVREAGLPVSSWGSSLPAEIGNRVRTEVDRITKGVKAALAEETAHGAFVSPYGAFLPRAGAGLFGQVFAMAANQVAAVEIFEAVIRQYDLRALVLGCDNNHVQRVLVDLARRRGIPSLQLAHGIYAPVRPRLAGEMSTVYASRVAAFGARARDVLVGLGNAAERIVLTGAPLWDELYGAARRTPRDEARRRLGLEPHRPTVLFCGTYADGSSAFFPSVSRRVAVTYRTLATAAARGGFQLVVRPHPQELDRVGMPPADRARLIEGHCRTLASQMGSDVRIVTDRKIESVCAADVVVTMGCSTMIPEAMILQRPVVTVPFIQQEPPVYTAADGICVANEASALPEVVQTLLGDTERCAAMVTAQNLALPALNYGNDGRASGRVVRAIVEMAAETRSGGPRAPQRVAGLPALDVLLAAHDFLPNSAGTELYTHDLARALERRGHHVRVLFPRYRTDGGAAEVQEGLYQGLPVAGLLIGADAVRLSRNDAIKPVLREYLARRRPDVVHVQHLMGLSVSFLEVLRDLDIPVVLTVNDFWFLCEQGHLVHATGARCTGPDTIDGCVQCLSARVGSIPERELPGVFHYMADRSFQHREALRIPDLVICPSRFLLETFRHYGFEGRRMVHLPQGANLFTPGERRATAGRPLAIGYLGTIGHRKGLDLLVHAFNEVETDHAELHVHGKIVDEAYFIETMRAAAPGKPVKYHGPFGPSDLPDILATVDVGVVPSRGENFPFVIREMLHAGVPVIGPRVGGIPEIIADGVNGLLFAANDAGDLARALATVIGAPERVDTLRRGIRPVRSIDEEAYQIEREYVGLLAGRPAERAREAQTPVDRPTSHEGDGRPHPRRDALGAFRGGDRSERVQPS